MTCRKKKKKLNQKQLFIEQVLLGLLLVIMKRLEEVEGIWSFIVFERIPSVEEYIDIFILVSTWPF